MKYCFSGFVGQIGYRYIVSKKKTSMTAPSTCQLVTLSWFTPMM